jgi:hypothetical protein
MIVKPIDNTHKKKDLTRPNALYTNYYFNYKINSILL